MENGGDPGGIGSLVSRADWGELERQRSDEEQLAESSLAASAPDSAALRAQVAPLQKNYSFHGLGSSSSTHPDNTGGEGGEWGVLVHNSWRA